MVAGGGNRAGVSFAAVSSGWLLPLIGGVAIAGGASLSAWLAALTIARDPGRGWDRYYAAGVNPQPLSFPPLKALFLVNGSFHSGTQYYLGWYWLVALAGGFLIVVLWWRRSTLAGGGRSPGRGLLVAGAVTVAAALAAPILALVVPALSGLWMNHVWVAGVPALVIIAAAIAGLAYLRRSRMALLVLAGYAALALPTGWLVLLACALLVAGLASFARWHRGQAA